MFRRLILLVSFFLSTNVFALDTTTPGTVVLVPTINCIGVTAPFTGDDNANNTATVEYRETGSTSNWYPSYIPYIDRRALLGNESANGYQYQARVSIVGLDEDTSYDVRVTWSDPDGIVGSSSSTTATITVTRNPTTGGSDYYVDDDSASEGVGSAGDPFKTITYAMSQMSAGDILHVVAGTYSSFEWTLSGSPSSYIKIIADDGRNCIIGGGATYTVKVSANYVILDGFNIGNSLVGVLVPANQHNIYLQNLYMPDVGDEETFGSGAFYTSAGCYDIFVLNNVCETNRDPTVLQGLFGIIRYGSGQYSLVYDGNTFSGTFWDILGSGGIGFGHHDVDFANNVCNGFKDDGLEFDGDAINERCWGNVFVSDGTDCVSAAPVYVGPAYVFRNVLTGKQTTGGYKLGFAGGTDGPVYIFHNTLDSTTGTDGVTSSGGGIYANLEFYNNIIKNIDKNIAPGLDGNSYDYNVYANYTVAHFRATWDPGEALNYTSLVDVQTNESQELNTIDAQQEDLWQDGSYLLNADVSAIDAGVVLNNFNDATSKWRFHGTAPDVGAFEYGLSSITATTLSVAP